jgi:hypothetical protein
MSELVSEAKFPVSWENTGNCFRQGTQGRIIGPKCRSYYSSLGSNSLRFGTGNLFAPNRELEGDIRELDSLIREPGLSDVKF